MDLHGRSLLKEIDFTEDEFLFLVDLADRAHAMRSAPGTERPRLAGAQHRPDLREGLHPHPLRLRGRPPTTRGRT